MDGLVAVGQFATSACVFGKGIPRGQARAARVSGLQIVENAGLQFFPERENTT